MPVHTLFKKSTAGAVVFATVILPGRIVLQNHHLLSSTPAALLSPTPTCNITVENHMTAVARLVNKLDTTAISVQLGNMIPGFG